MSAGGGRRRLHRAGAAGLILGTALSPTAARASASPPRVIQLQPRVITLRPRVISVAPKRQGRDAFTVGSDVLFAFDRSDLSPDARLVLGDVVTRLRHHRQGTVRIVGYTDSIGTRQFNLRLSRRRAASVRRYLQSRTAGRGLHYRTEGRGEADPVAPNTLPGGRDNPAGRRRNRRVAIIYRPR